MRRNLQIQIGSKIFPNHFLVVTFSVLSCSSSTLHQKFVFLKYFSRPGFKVNFAYMHARLGRVNASRMETIPFFNRFRIYSTNSKGGYWKNGLLLLLRDNATKLLVLNLTDLGVFGAGFSEVWPEGFVFRDSDIVPVHEKGGEVNIRKQSVAAAFEVIESEEALFDVSPEESNFSKNIINSSQVPERGA